jgi:hypothetical protein
MWMKWLPWRLIVRNLARRQGFLDPLDVFSRLRRFAQPSEVAVPIELLRSGVVLHARGLMNSQAIQHNLDWVWPFWVERQFSPEDPAFIPRAFSITHINLTNRNWTAVGLPDTGEWPLVDPRGLLTPFYDGWSIDCWIVSEDGKILFPSRLPLVTQRISTRGNLCVTTESQFEKMRLVAQTEVEMTDGVPVCHARFNASAPVPGWLVVTLRPYNPEGVSFIHDIAVSKDPREWIVNGEGVVCFSVQPQRRAFSDYRSGDVFRHLPVNRQDAALTADGMTCEVGMATAAALFEISPDVAREVVVKVPLLPRFKKNEARDRKEKKTGTGLRGFVDASGQWDQASEKAARLNIPDGHFRFLYETAVRTVILHSPREVYPGPYTYRRFWFRDAAFILHAMLCVGLKDRVKRTLDIFPARQTAAGYYFSQKGEWDSNGEALWIIRRFCELSAQAPERKWQRSIDRGGRWIARKRLASGTSSPHAGLMPPGFSAEHLGPNDYYYWDDFWGVEGLRAAAFLAGLYGDKTRQEYFLSEAGDFLKRIEESLARAADSLGQAAMPASPYRRLDSGAVGSLAAGYPLRIWDAEDKRLLETVDFLMRNCFVKGGFFQDMIHSGINPYLTLHIAQVLLRAGDGRYFDLMKTVAGLASATGQWPEAVHPRTGGGCMGDGQHVWAAAEWLMMIRNCFIREEGESLILCSGIPEEWVREGAISFGPAPTPFGGITVSADSKNGRTIVRWEAQWFSSGLPGIEVRLPGFLKARARPGENSVALQREERSCGY